MARMPMYREHVDQVNIASGTDEVINFCIIPPGGTLRNVWLDVIIIGDDDISIEQVATYDIDGFILEFPDPDTIPTTPHEIWDELVPKSDIYGATVDYDTSIPDTDPVSEYGEVNVTNLFGGYIPERAFQRRGILTPQNKYSIPTTSTTYRPMDRFKTQIGHDYYTEKPSVFMLGLSSPNWTELTQGYTGDSGEWAPSTKQEWAALAFPEVVMEDWWKASVGLTTHIDEELSKQLFRWTSQLHIETATCFEDLNYKVFVFGTYLVVSPEKPVTVLHSGM